MLLEAFGLGGSAIILFAIFFAVLGFLVPWFVWRTSVYTRESRDLLEDVKRILRQNQLQSENPFKKTS
jgi:hypothetical protein